MLDLKFFQKILFPETTKYPYCRLAPYEDLPTDGLTMGTLFIGKQGSGKTTSLAGHLIENFLRYPKRGIVVLDESGADSDEIIDQVARLPDYEKHCERIRVVELGHPELVVPLSSFSQEFGTVYEEQAQQAARNLQNLSPELVSGAPFVAGLGLQETAPQLFRILTSIPDAHGGTWQITEARELLTNTKLLARLVGKYGDKVPQAMKYFQKEFLPLSQHEKELRTYALRSLLGPLEAPEIRAMLGYEPAGFTFKEVLEKGLFAIIDASRLKNRKVVQHVLFTDIYSKIMAEVYKRRPNDPNDEPFSLVAVEVAPLMKVKGLASEISEQAPLLRSRKVQTYFSLQELSQMGEELRDHIWSLGNIVCFAMSNFNEAYEMAQQIFRYDPNTIKRDARSDTGQPIVETDRGQYLQIANDIQRLNHRECIVRRYLTEQKMDRYVQWVKKTRDKPRNPPYIDPRELKQLLIKRHAVNVEDALKVINRRTETTGKTKGTAPSL